VSRGAPEGRAHVQWSDARPALPDKSVQWTDLSAERPEHQRRAAAAPRSL